MDQQKLAEIFVHLNLNEQPQDNRKEYLEQLKTVLSNVKTADINEALVSISLETLFDCLDTSDEDQIQVTCDILRILMTVIDPAEFLNKYEVYVLEGFKHPVSAVRGIVLEQLQRCINTPSPNGANLLCTEYQDLIIAAIHQISCDDLSVVKLVDQFVVHLAETQPGAEFILGPAGTELFSSILNNPRNSGVVKFRMYETLVNLGRISAGHLEKLENQHHLVIQPLLEIILDSNDPLGQLNGLEILAELANTPHGYNAILAAGLISKLKGLSQNWKEDGMVGLIFPGIIKFIGKIGTRAFPDEDLVKLVLDAIMEGEHDLTTVGIEAFTFIGSTSEGKQNLHKQPDLNKCFAKIRSVLQEGVQPFRSRALNALAGLFGSDEENERCLPFWFYQIFPDITELHHLVQQPFPDIRLSALNFLAAIAHIEWAQKHYLRVAGVLEFLTNRGIEPNKECALAKFRIVSIIVDSASAKKFIKPDDLSLLKMHVEQGPFYVVARPTMETEGAE